MNTEITYANILANGLGAYDVTDFYQTPDGEWFEIVERQGLTGLVRSVVPRSVAGPSQAEQDALILANTARVSAIEGVLSGIAVDFADDGVLVHGTARGGIVVGPFQASGLNDIRLSASAIGSGTGSFSLVTTDPTAAAYPIVSSVGTELNGAIAGAVLGVPTADRITPTLLEKTFEFDFVEGTDYWAVLFAGGGSDVANLGINVGSGALTDVSSIEERVKVLEEGENPLIVTGATGKYRVGDEHRPAIPIGINNTSIVTDHDLTTPGAKLVISFSDVDGRPWPVAEIDLAGIETAGLAPNQFYVWNHSGAFLTGTITDYATGTITFTDNNRPAEYVASELVITAPNANPLFEVANTGTIIANGTFQNLGDLDTRITGADGDEVTLEYGDGNRDTFVFLDSIAKSERKGGSTTDTELQVVGDQLQVRTISGGSGITKAWYKQHINAGVIAASGDTDTEILRHRATAVNAGGQTAGNALFQIETGDDVTQLTDLITYSAGVVSGQYPYDIEIVADFRTLGTGAASRVYHFRDVLAGNAVGDVSGTSGVFGQGSAQVPARVTVPANTAFSYDVRSVSSAENQAGQIGNSLYVTASDVSREEAVTERLSAELYINAGPFGGTAPPGAKLGIDTVNSVFYIVNGAGNWEALP